MQNPWERKNYFNLFFLMGIGKYSIREIHLSVCVQQSHLCIKEIGRFFTCFPFTYVLFLPLSCAFFISYLSIVHLIKLSQTQCLICLFIFLHYFSQSITVIFLLFVLLSICWNWGFKQSLFL